MLITIGLKEIIAKVEHLAADLAKPGDLMMVAAQAVAVVVKAHFVVKAAKPNKHDFPSQGFWAQIRASVQTFREGDAGIIQINDPRFNIHYYGGTVKPKESEALTIPVAPQAYGVRAATFDDLVMLRSKKQDGKTIGVLARRLGSGAFGAAVEVYYVLVSSAVIPKDPEALPAESAMEAEAGKAIEIYLKQLISE
jgi:hypothetical protein